MDSASALQNTSISDLGFLQLDQSDDTHHSLIGSAVTVSLDPYYDRKFNEITRKLDQLLKLQKGNVDLTGNDSGVDLNITFPVRTKEEL
uniref:Uncharacterized protein n=2 Tax=Phlebotomus papatasi TaxID=29031 RepID=A0A1B0DMS1_PHLPP